MRRIACTVLALWFAAGPACGQEDRPQPKPVPRVQVLPLPYDQARFELDARPLTTAHYGPSLRRPFLYPILGPSGRSLTRMGHPHDPVTHSHHNSVWISHQDVNGFSFWADPPFKNLGQIVHQRVLRYDDSDTEASQLSLQHWVGGDGKTLLKELRRITIVSRGEAGWWAVIDLQLEPAEGAVTFGKTPFGLIGVRMAKTIGVRDGGGTIRNSEGGVNEKEIFWKPARWVDYSGPILTGKQEGITLMDHRQNPRHPNPFHVRNDGWMGASISFAEPLALEPGEKLRVAYGLFVHGEPPSAETIDAEWRAFSERPLDDLAPPVKK